MPPVARADHFRLAGRLMGLTTSADFRSSVGLTENQAAVTWNMFDLWNVQPHTEHKHLLWACIWLRQYGNEATLCGMARCSRPTFRKYSRPIVIRLSMRRGLVIRLSNRFRGDRGRTCKMTIDCTDCMIWEPIPFSKKWFTFKYKCAGYRYEVGVCIQTGDICWINGPFKCGRWNDLMIFRRDLKGRLGPGEMVETDGGYKGDAQCRNKWIYFNPADKRAKDGARARQENIIGDIKDWTCLKQKWRHGRPLHKHAFAAAAVLTQLAYSRGNPPRQVRY